MEIRSNWGGVRPGAGRPKGSGKGIKRVVFQVSCQPEELEQIEKRSKELGLSKSGYIVSLVRNDV